MPYRMSSIIVPTQSFTVTTVDDINLNVFGSRRTLGANSPTHIGGYPQASNGLFGVDLGSHSLHVRIETLAVRLHTSADLLVTYYVAIR